MIRLARGWASVGPYLIQHLPRALPFLVVVVVGMVMGCKVYFISNEAYFTMKLIQAYNSMMFIKFVRLCDHHRTPFREFPSPGSSLVPISVGCAHSQLMTTTDLLSVSINLSFWDILCQ